MDPLPIQAPSLEEGLCPPDSFSRVPPLPGEPESRAMLLLLLALSRSAMARSRQIMQLTPLTQDARRDLALIRRAVLCGEAELISLISGISRQEQGLLWPLLAMDVSAALAARLQDSPFRRALDFSTPEWQDMLYRLANLIFWKSPSDPRQLLGSRAEIMPGRPLIACHRHPYDGVCKPQKNASLLDRLGMRLVSAAAEGFLDFLQSMALQSDDALERGLYLELSLIAEQQCTLFLSLLPVEQPLEGLLNTHAALQFAGASCENAMENSDWKAFLRERLARSQACMDKLRILSSGQGKPSLAIPALPAPLMLRPSKGYVRDTLDHVGATLLRDRQVPVGVLPRGADFFRYQKRICPREAALPSHALMAEIIARQGCDYRFEIAPHPVDGLRSRGTDNTAIGR